MKKSNPCSICEKFMKGIQCDEADACPVGLMKKENANLKRRVTKYEQDASWAFEDRVERSREEEYERGRWGIFG